LCCDREMSENAERMKRVIEFRGKLENRVEEVETELKDLQATLEAVNSILLEKGFKRADTVKGPSESQDVPLEKEVAIASKDYAQESPLPSENVFPLKTASGELLAVLYLTDNSLRALPAADKNFEVNTSPFNQFLVERVLMKMQERDNELIRTGQLRPDCALTYSIIREGDTIREICVNNVDPERLRELKSSIRWTLEKMLEKSKMAT
jgi:hypothetical protein